MTEVTFAVLMVLVLGWAVTSHLLDRHNITGALVFAVAGYLLGNPTWGLLTVDVATPSIHLLAELALALLLFADAARVNVSQLRRDIVLPGTPAGHGSSPLGDPRLARCCRDVRRLLLGPRRFRRGDLAPTDAALSAQVINDERIPLRLRRALNVESGLNDGIATPIVVFTLAIVAGEVGATSHAEPPRQAARWSISCSASSWASCSDSGVPD